MSNPFEHLRPSPNPMSIYYADLFRINERVWCIFGCGKSEAARIASNKRRDSDLVRDAAGLVRRGSRLFGRYDPGAINDEADQRCGLHAYHQIDVLAYCFYPNELQKFFPDNPGTVEPIDASILSVLVASHTYPAYMAEHFFAPERLGVVADPATRFKHFVELTSDLTDTPVIGIPWFETCAEKTALYRAWKPDPCA